MAAWIKMSLGMELGLGPGDFVLDRDPAPPSQKGGAGSQMKTDVAGCDKYVRNRSRLCKVMAVVKCNYDVVGLNQ